MRWPILVAAAALGTALAGCDKLPFFGKKAQDTTAVDTTQLAEATEPADTAMAPTGPTEPAEPEPTPVSRPLVQLVDEPWEPVDTGTVQPGMARMEVTAVWGVPVAERAAGNRAYLYFRNGCEVTCGTFDVVFLEDGQVVDAIVRGPGHTYAGVSSSPPDRLPEATAPVRQQSGESGADR